MKKNEVTTIELEAEKKEELARFLKEQQEILNTYKSYKILLTPVSALK